MYHESKSFNFSSRPCDPRINGRIRFDSTTPRQALPLHVSADIDQSLFERFEPLNKLSAKGRVALKRGMLVADLPADSYLFRTGQLFSNVLFFLVEGSVTLVTPEKHVIAMVKCNDSTVMPQIHKQVPCINNAIAETSVRVLKVNADLLNNILIWDQQPTIGNNANQNELTADNDTTADNEDWMTIFLSAHGFCRLPPRNLQMLFQCLQPINFKSGEVIFEQGTMGTRAFVIAEGQCLVTRDNGNGQAVKVGLCGPGACIGEDSLITDEQHPVSMTMKTDGRLMSVSKLDFLNLVKTPLCRPFNLKQAQEAVANGAIWIDVHVPINRSDNSSTERIKMPMYILRSRINTLDPYKTYITCDNKAKLSSLASYLLRKAGLDAYYLAGLALAAKPMARMKK